MIKLQNNYSNTKMIHINQQHKLKYKKVMNKVQLTVWMNSRD